MKRFVQARVNGGSNYDSLKQQSEHHREEVHCKSKLIPKDKAGGETGLVTVKLEAASFLVCEGFVVKRSALNTLKLTQRRFARRVDERSFSYTHGLVLSDQTEFGGIGLAVQRRGSPKSKLTWSPKFAKLTCRYSRGGEFRMPRGGESRNLHATLIVSSWYSKDPGVCFWYGAL